MAQSISCLPRGSADCFLRTGSSFKNVRCCRKVPGPVLNIKGRKISNLSAGWTDKLKLRRAPVLKKLDHVGVNSRVRVLVRASDDEGGTFNWAEGSIVIPKFDENFNPVDESGAVIEVPSPRGVKKKKERAPKLDADGNVIEPKKRGSKAKKQKVEDPDSDEKRPRAFRTAKDIAHEAEVAVAKAKARKKAAQKKALEAKEAAAAKQLEEGETAGEESSGVGEEGELERGGKKVEAEIAPPVDSTDPPPDPDLEPDPEPLEDVEARAIAELESRGPDLSETERRTLQTLKRSRKGRLQSQLREYALKQMPNEKMEEKRAALLIVNEPRKAKWHVVYCKAPESAVADDFRRAVAKYAPTAEVDIRTPELPHVRFTKNGEPRRYTTFLRNRVVFVWASLTEDVKLAMSHTKGMYNVEGADKPDSMGGTPTMEAERFVEMIDDAERKVSTEIAAMAAKLEKEKADVAAKKAAEAAAKNGTNGTHGTDGTDGTNGTDAAAAAAKGADGTDGTDGVKDGTAGGASEAEAGPASIGDEPVEVASASPPESSEATGGKYAPGSDVTVARGPFAGLPAKVTERNSKREELKVEIMILGQPSEATVKFKDVRPAKPPAVSNSAPFDPFRRTDSASGSSEARAGTRTSVNWAENDTNGLGNGSRSDSDGFSSDSDGFRSGLDWSRGGLDGLRGESDGSGFSEGFAGIPEGLRRGLRGNSGGDLDGVSEEDDDETDQVPLRSGVGLVVKKGPFKGCTGHVVDVLLDKGLISVQIPDEGEIRLQPLEAEPEQGGRWSLPPGFEAITAPVRKLILAKPKKQLLWLDEDDATDEPPPKPKLGADGRPTDPDWSRFEKKPRGLENDTWMDGADPRQGEIAWQRVSVKTPEGRPKRVLVKYLGTNTANTAEMLLVEDLDVMTGVWRRLNSGKGSGSGQKRSRRKKDEKAPAFL